MVEGEVERRIEQLVRDHHGDEDGGSHDDHSSHDDGGAVSSVFRNNNEEEGVDSMGITGVILAVVALVLWAANLAIDINI